MYRRCLVRRVAAAAVTAANAAAAASPSATPLSTPQTPPSSTAAATVPSAPVTVSTTPAPGGAGWRTTNVLHPNASYGTRKEARQTPIWSNFVITGGMVVGALCSAALMYFLRKGYSAMRSEGDDRFIATTLRDEMMLRPLWSQALVYAAAHYAFLPPGPDGRVTPFAQPLAVPSIVRKEIDEVHDFLKALHAKQPQVSMVDLWVCAVIYALSAVGGPYLAMKWGRFLDAEDTVRVPYAAGEVVTIESALPANERNPLKLKTVLAAKGFPTDEIVALLGHRGLGLHAPTALRVAPLEMRDVLDPEVLIGKKDRRESSLQITTDQKAGEREGGSGKGASTATKTASSGAAGATASTTWTYGSTTPGVFTNEYFAALLQGKWQDVGGVNFVRKAKNAAQLSDERTFVAEPPPAGVAKKDLVCDKAYGVVMQPCDAALLDDAMLRGWAVKFAENEVRFMNSYLRAMERVLDGGWTNVELRESK